MLASSELVTARVRALAAQDMRTPSETFENASASSPATSKRRKEMAVKGESLRTANKIMENGSAQAEQSDKKCSA